MSSTDSDRLIPVKAAAAIAGVCRAQIYNLVNAGKFPQPVKIGSSTRFSERECHAWVSERIAARDRGESLKLHKRGRR